MIYAFGSFELDMRVYELRHCGGVCPVEPQVFNVLAYLAEHRDRLVSKEELLEKLWQDRFVSETTLTSRLKAARKAVGDDGKAQSVIRTIHGRGYRFVAEVRVIEAEAIAAPAALATPVASIAATPGFVGRDAELARLHQALARACDRDRQVVFVTGEAGAGKTTLVERFLGDGQALPMFVARGQCVEHRGSGEPYMPLLDALGRLCRGAHGPRIIELLRRDAPSWLLQLPWLLSDEDASLLAARSSSGERMLRELVMLIERMTEELPLVLVLEDLHWSDSATLEAIDLVARHTHPARLLIIGTFRPYDGKAGRHPVLAAAQELRARGQCELIELPLLDVPEIDDYLRARLPGADFVCDLAALLHERTSGNPLFVGNLVSSWIARGLLREYEGEWLLAASMATLETDVPESLQQLIEKRLLELETQEQEILETASLIGREFSIALLAASVPADEEEVERRCESLARGGRFLAAAGTEPWGDGRITSRFAFTHDLYVDVLCDRIPVGRRARLHRRAGLALERIWLGRERERAAEMALHFQRASDHPRAIRYLEVAAEQAMQCSAYREAVLHFTAALDLLGETEPSPERDGTELEIRLRLAPALIATRGWADADAEKNYHRGCDLARAIGDRAVLSQMLYGMAVMYEYRGNYRRAERIILERLAFDGDAAVANAVESHELLTCSMLHQGRYAEAVQFGERAIAAAEESAEPLDPRMTAVLVRAHGWMSGALVFLGRHEEAIAHGAIALRLADTAGDELARVNALIQAAFVRFYRRQPEECRRLSAAAEAIARERRLPFHLSCARILLGWCLSHEGSHEQALREVRAGIRTSLVSGARLEVPLFLAILAECLDRAGEREPALEVLDEAFAHVGRSRSFFYVPELYRMSADLLLARGDHDTARTALEEAQAIAEEQESPLFTSRVAESLGRVVAPML
jgi:DNA-binding winged helix-turn-helix (wHTH) protein/tetratricopeptide (TPR) repeat protein